MNTQLKVLPDRAPLIAALEEGATKLVRQMVALQDKPDSTKKKKAVRS